MDFYTRCNCLAPTPPAPPLPAAPKTRKQHRMYFGENAYANKISIRFKINIVWHQHERARVQRKKTEQKPTKYPVDKYRHYSFASTIILNYLSANNSDESCAMPTLAARLLGWLAHTRIVFVLCRKRHTWNAIYAFVFVGREYRLAVRRV